MFFLPIESSIVRLASFFISHRWQTPQPILSVFIKPSFIRFACRMTGSSFARTACRRSSWLGSSLHLLKVHPQASSSFPTSESLIYAKLSHKLKVIGVSFVCIVHYTGHYIAVRQPQQQQQQQKAMMANIIILISIVILFTVHILRCCQYLKHFSKVNIIYTRQFASLLALYLVRSFSV